jgi:hypothetical protein
MNTKECLQKIASDMEAGLEDSVGTPAERKQAVTDLYEMTLTNDTYEGMPKEHRLLLYQMHRVMLDAVNGFERLNGISTGSMPGKGRSAE